MLKKRSEAKQTLFESSLGLLTLWRERHAGTPSTSHD